MNNLFNKIQGYGFVRCKCKEFNNYVDYLTAPIVLKIEVECDRSLKRGEITRYILKDHNTIYDGDSRNRLLEVFGEIVKKYDLKNIAYNIKRMAIIWVNNLNMIEGFFSSCKTNGLKNRYIELFNVLEFRLIKPWNNEVIDKPLCEQEEYLKFLYSSLFVPNKYFYISPNQIIRKKLNKSLKNTTRKELAKLFPKSYREFKYLRKGLYGGLAVCNYPGLTIEKPILYVDLTSAYIYCLLCCKHVMGLGEIVPTDDYRPNLGKTNFGKYEITFNNTEPTSLCYKDITHMSPEYGVQTRTYHMNDIDLELFKKMNKVLDIKCKSLREYTLDYLPKYVRDTLVEEYIKKSQYEGEARRLQKVKLCGIYGETIKKCKNVGQYNALKNNFNLLPQWGIWTTSYCKQHLYKVASEVDGWLYSNTDSIFCLDTHKNRIIIRHYNSIIRETVRQFCLEFGYDFEKLKGLGEFKIEEEIKKFRAIAINEYMYTTNEGKFIVKAAGCEQKIQKLTEDLYNKPSIPLGYILFQHPDPKRETYYEYYLRDDEARLALQMGNLIDTFFDSI